MSAAFGFNSEAAIRADQVFDEVGTNAGTHPKVGLLIGRSIQRGFPEGTSNFLTKQLAKHLTDASLASFHSTGSMLH
jgi:hypothetical protein